MLNQARLKVLRVREEHVRAVLDGSRSRLSSAATRADEYKDLLVSLTVQALFQVIIYKNNIWTTCAKPFFF